jgi:hypothetical protein
MPEADKRFISANFSACCVKKMAEWIQAFTMNVYCDAKGCALLPGLQRSEDRLSVGAPKADETLYPYPGVEGAKFVPSRTAWAVRAGLLLDRSFSS